MSKYNINPSSKINNLTAVKNKYDLSIFKNRILQMNNSRFLIYKIDSDKLQCIRIYDKNGLKINIEKHLEYNQFENIPLSDIFNNTYIFTIEESKQIIEDQKMDSKNILKIYYELVNLQENNWNKELIPYKILPESVNINQYNLNINNNKITEVRHKDTGSIINFEAILVKEGTKFSGFVSTSSLKVYTTLYNKDIMNIIHLHLNDTSEEIAVDSTFLQRGHSVSDEKYFTTDHLGKKLNYKFIFRDYKLLKVFYNVSKEFIDEPDFEEIRIKNDKIVKIKDHNLYSNYFAKIHNIPLGMIVRKEKDNTDLLERLRSSEVKVDGYCQERHLEELPGLVDIDIMFSPDTEMLETYVRLSLPVCRLIPLTPKEELIFEKKVLKSQIRKKSMSLETLNYIFEQYLGLERFCNDYELLNTLSLDEVKKILEFVEKDIPNDIRNSIDDDNENRNKLDRIEDLRIRLVPILHKHIRLISLMGYK